MTGEAAAAAEGKVRGADKYGPLPFDTSVAHQARIYDYLLEPLTFCVSCNSGKFGPVGVSRAVSL